MSQCDCIVSWSYRCTIGIICGMVMDLGRLLAFALVINHIWMFSSQVLSVIRRKKGGRDFWVWICNSECLQIFTEIIQGQGRIAGSWNKWGVFFHGHAFILYWSTSVDAGRWLVSLYQSQVSLPLWEQSNVSLFHYFFVNVIQMSFHNMINSKGQIFIQLFNIYRNSTQSVW